ncbi:RRP15-like protein isoform X2 [Zootermopsis nevadensis]|nr:RRP15-like protein isoform X2 [Zootermopsis nevadensis]XP_021936191.1 RRP15-like protein isoform X2 [Zootermopsis nevadensis]
MSRVLRSKKPKKSRSVVLSRAKKLNDAAKTVKEEDTELEVGDIKPRISSLNEQRSRRKQEQKSKCRVKPNILDHDYERRLNRIATRGVVQLFNAVRQQQKSLECQLKEAGSSERKRDKVMKSLDKRAFIDILLGSSRSEPVDSPVKLEAEIKREEEEEQYNTWHVLRDDFMLGTARLKDWDKTDAPT